MGENKKESNKESKKSELPRSEFQERHVVNRGDFVALDKSEKNPDRSNKK